MSLFHQAQREQSLRFDIAFCVKFGVSREPGRVLALDGHGGEGDTIESGTHAVLGGHIMLFILAVIFLVLWALGFFAFHVTNAALHLLLVVAVIVVVVELLSGRRSV